MGGLLGTVSQWCIWNAHAVKNGELYHHFANVADCQAEILTLQIAYIARVKGNKKLGSEIDEIQDDC